MTAKTLRHAALSLLARREHSRVELCRKLLEKHCILNDIQAVLDALQKDDLQSDARYAEMVARVRFNKGYGPNYIKAYLHDKGVAANLIEIALDPYKALWMDKLIETYQRKYAYTVPSYGKVYRFFVQRGFLATDIQRVYFDLKERGNT